MSRLSLASLVSPGAAVRASEPLRRWSRGGKPGALRTAVRASLAMAFLASGCATAEPLEPQERAKLPQLLETVEPPAGAAEAVPIIRAELELRVGELPEPPPILWAPGRLAYVVPDPECEGRLGCYIWRDGLVFVDVVHVTRQGDQLSDSLSLPGGGTTADSGTVLVHELIHWSLMMTTGDADGDHLGALWSAQEPIRERLSAEGL